MRRRKLFVFVFLLVVILSCVFFVDLEKTEKDTLGTKSKSISGKVVGYTSECSDANALFYLSDTTNAHASINKIIGSYEVPVCLDELDSAPGVSGIGLRLSSSTNAHASFADSNYLTLIYVGEYICFLDSVSGSCIGGSECLVTLSSSDGNNAHLGSCSGADAYSTTVCCNPPATQCTAKTCAVDYPGQCGTGLDDGCEGTLDCSSNCGGTTPYCDSNDLCVECLDVDNCNDNVDCTDDGCVSGICVNTPNDALCSLGYNCHLTLGCIQSTCSGCENCDTFFTGCDYDECHICLGGPCYYKGIVIGNNCIKLSDACISMGGSLIDECSDYSDLECVNNPCHVSNGVGCLLIGTDCIECEDDDDCLFDDVCYNDKCCVPGTQIEICTTGRCGVWGDNCGGTVDCGDPCGTDICSNPIGGTCVSSCTQTNWQDTGIYRCDGGDGGTKQKQQSRIVCPSGDIEYQWIDSPCDSSETCEGAGNCITAIYWADMNGVLINNAQIGDSVLMVYKQGENYAPLTFDIYENDLDGGTGLADDEIRTGIESFELNGNTVAKWEIIIEDLIKTSDYEEFEFRVDGKISGYLEIITTETNSPPSITITKPVDGSKYTIDYNHGDETEDIEFEQLSFDVDDDLKVIWDFGDGTNSSWFENCLTTGDCDTTHKYDSSGTKTIFATAEEITRGQSAINYSNIYIYKKGINVFSKIASPIVDGRVVQMNGSDSFACECYETSVDCDDAVNCYEIDDGIDELWCKDFIIGVDYDFIFQWIFDKGTDDEETKIGTWSENYNDVVEFTHFFRDLGVHTVELKTGYIAN